MKPIEKSQIEQALNRDRPETDIERDENRMPAELLHFIEISEGQKVGEMNSGRGYLSAQSLHMHWRIMERSIPILLHKALRDGKAIR